MSKLFNCEFCGKENIKKHPKVSRNKYCNSKCAGDHKAAMRKEEWYSGKAHKIQRPTLRRYLAEDRGYYCDCCGISDWNGRSITLQVDHIDGNPSDHSPGNVRLICPNCHSQQDTWGARNKGSGRKSRGMNLN